MAVTVCERVSGNIIASYVSSVTRCTAVLNTEQISSSRCTAAGNVLFCFLVYSFNINTSNIPIQCLGFSMF